MGEFACARKQHVLEGRPGATGGRREIVSRSARQLYRERRQAAWVEDEVIGPELNSSEGRNDPEGERSELHGLLPGLNPAYHCDRAGLHRPLREQRRYKK